MARKYRLSRSKRSLRRHSKRSHRRSLRRQSKRSHRRSLRRHSRRTRKSRHSKRKSRKSRHSRRRTRRRSFKVRGGNIFHRIGDWGRRTRLGLRKTFTPGRMSQDDFNELQRLEAERIARAQHRY